jgi:hypothetical protein
MIFYILKLKDITNFIIIIKETNESNQIMKLISLKNDKWRQNIMLLHMHSLMNLFWEMV